jgi:hypothetical protein
MQSLTLHSRTGKDGILKLEMPIGVPDTDFEVVLVVQPIKGKKQPKLKTTNGWPSNFFTEVIGGWQGEPLVREPQGDYETRDELK